MRKLLIGVAIVPLLAVTALAVVPSLVPSSVYKEKIQTQLTKELARDVTIDGEVKLSVFPSIRAKTGRVVIANPGGFSSTNFAAMDGLEAKVKLLPLLSKRVEIAAFKLKNPVINLEKNKSGVANWVMGEEKPAAEKPEAGPFKRDGRYSDVDPAIGLFSIEDGAISYVDAVKGDSYDLADVNVKFSLPSLADTVKIDGDAVFNGQPLTMDMSLDSPRKFLNGDAAPLSLDLKTDFADVTAKGEFLASQDIAFDLNIDGDVSDIAALAAYLPKDLPLTELANTASLKGDYRYDGKVFSAKNAEITAQGDLLNAAYKGDAVMSAKPVLDGSVDLDVKDVPKLAALLKQDITGLDLAKTLTLKADMNAQGTGFAAKNIDAAIAGDGLDVTFKGTGAYGDDISAAGAFTANAASIPAIVDKLKLDLPQAAALGSADVKGQLNMTGDTLSVDVENAKTSGEALTASYTGKITRAGEAISAIGNFDADIPSVSNLAQIAKIDMPQAKAAGRLAIKGAVNHSGAGTKLTGLDVKTDGGVVEGQYTGDASLGEVMSFAGTFDSKIKSLTEFASVTGTDVPYAAAIGQITAKGRVDGQGEAITISGLDANLTDGQLNGRFEGNAAMAGGFNIDGNLNADIPSIRKLAETTGTQLPPSTKAGAIYEKLTITGRVKGNPSDISFKQAALAVDHLKGTGDFSVDLKGAKPFMRGALDMEGLDLRPYMASYAAQKPTGEIEPWSEEPINAAMLKTIDGDFKFNTPNIVTDRLSMGAANVDAKVRNGVMRANVPKVNLYGGLGSVNATLDASGAVPSIALDLDMGDLNSNKFLGAVAGFTRASGEGATALSIRGNGISQAAIMKSLQGQGDFKMLNGQMSGVDLTQLLSGLDTALTSRTLPGGIGSQYVTKFKDIAGLFKIENGVATINQFNLDGFGVAATGSGKIDLGGQNIDFRLQPRLTGESASNLAAFGIPLRLKGNFGDVSPSLDSDMLGKIAAAQAQAALKKELQKKVGGSAGNIIGGLLGGGQNTSQQAPTGTGTEAPAQQLRPEDAAKDLLGGLFGSKEPKAEPEQKTAPATTEAETKTEEEAKPKKKEPSLEDSLFDLLKGD